MDFIFIVSSGSSVFTPCASCPVSCPPVTSWATEPNTWRCWAQWNQLRVTHSSWGDCRSEPVDISWCVFTLFSAFIQVHRWRIFKHFPDRHCRPASAPVYTTFVLMVKRRVKNFCLSSGKPTSRCRSWWTWLSACCSSHGSTETTTLACWPMRWCLQPM